MSTEAISNETAYEVASSIIENETSDDPGVIKTMTDGQIGMYLCDKGIEETAENISAVRAA